jgi:hypothetical protein
VSFIPADAAPDPSVARKASNGPKIEGKPVRGETELNPDQPGPPTRLQLGTLELWPIRRGPRIGLRVRDRNSAARRTFHGLSYFPWQAEWYVQGVFERHPADQTLPITDVTGATKPEPNPGCVVFQYRGVTHRLEALLDSETRDLFILFRDLTNGQTTYPPGRFLHAPLPDATGHVVLDFNRAYNPPCAFTDSATCPRPPAANALPFAVAAGEKRYH